MPDQARPAFPHRSARQAMCAGRRKEGRFKVWRDHDDTVARLTRPGVRGLKFKVLSDGADGRDISMLVDVPAGWSQPVPAAGHGRFLILTDGAVIVDGVTLEPRGLIEIPAGVDGPLITSVTGARLLVKVAGW